MSLRAKLYLAFALMIVLVMLTGGLAIRAFIRTNRVVEATRQQVSNVSKILVPANRLATQVYTDINQAALHFYAYSFNGLETDYKSGMENIGQIKERCARLEEYMKMPRAEALAQSNGVLQNAKENLLKVETHALDLHASTQKIDGLQEVVNQRIGEMQAVLDKLYEDIMADVEVQFDDKDAVGMTPERKRLMETWLFLDEVFNQMAKAETSLWKGRGKFGDEASAVFNETAKMITDQRDNVRDFVAAGGFEDPAVEAGYVEIQGRLDAYTEAVGQFAAEWVRCSTLNTSIGQESELVLNAFDALDESTSNLVIGSADDAYNGTVEIDAIVDRSTIGSAIILAIATVIGCALALIITRSIVRPINSVIVSLTHGEQIIGEAAANISQSSQDLAEGVTEQAASLEETSSALEQVSAMTKASAANANNTNANTRKTAELISGGAEDMREMSAAMAKINEQADRISNIIKTIEEIAFQTNLLALNAAVEAARAGEAGKGFAVVADEVRSLSGRSAQAAKDTAELINATVDSVRSGSGILQRLSGSYDEIEKGVGSIGELISQIANAADEQSQGVEQINTAISQMDKITQQNAAGASESAASVQNLEGQITDLRENVATLQSIVSGGNKTRTRRNAPAGRMAPPSRQLTGPAVMRPDYIE